MSRSLGSKDEVQTNGQTDGGDSITSRANVVSMVMLSTVCHLPHGHLAIIAMSHFTGCGFGQHKPVTSDYINHGWQTVR